MVKVLKGLILTTILVFSHTSFAGDYYFLVAVGTASGEADFKAAGELDDSDIDWRKTDDDDMGWSLGIGYPVNDIIAIEFAYNDYGNLEGQVGVADGDLVTSDDTIFDFAVDTTALSIATLANVPLTSKLSAYAKLGLDIWHVDYTLSIDFDGGGGSARDSDGRIDFFYGLGLNYAASDKISVFIDYSQHSMDGTFTSLAIESNGGNASKIDFDLTMISLGAHIKF